MFVRVGGIELKRPILKRLMDIDGGLIVYCDAIKDLHNEAHLQKLMAYEGSTQHVRWQDADGMDSEHTMSVLAAKKTEREGPDGKIITEYVYTLVLI